MSWTSGTHLSPSTYHSPDHRTVAEIQNKVIKQSGRHRVTQFLHARNDKDMIAGWKSDLNRILVVFNVGSMLCCFDVANFSLFRPSLI